MKEDGINIGSWVEALAVLCGHLCKRYPGGMEMVAICQYLANQLKISQTLDLVVLKQLISRVAGIEHVEDIGDSQVEMLAGGRFLQVSGLLKVEQSAQMKFSSERLKFALLSGEESKRLCVPLLILLAQQRNALMFSLLNPPLKLISELVDKSQSAFLQFSSFLKEEFKDDYLSILPEMEEMESVFKLQPEYIFHVYRPVMREVFDRDFLI